jgi:hypothetical protein
MDHAPKQRMQHDRGGNRRVDIAPGLAALDDGEQAVDGGLAGGVIDPQGADSSLSRSLANSRSDSRPSGPSSQ